jgi:putative ABC transport system permease protein
VRFVLLLAWRQLMYRPGKTLASVLGIAIGIATVVSVLVVDHNTLLTQDSERPEVDPDADLLIQPDLSAGRGLEVVRSDLEQRGILSGITAFARGTYSLSSGGKVRSGVELMALDAGAASYHGAYLVAEGDDLDYSSVEPQLLVGLKVAEKAGLSVGDLVELKQPPVHRRPVVHCVGGELVSESAPDRRHRESTRAQPSSVDEVFPFRVVGILAPTRLGFAGNRVLTTFDRGAEVFGRSLSVRFWADFDTTVSDLPAVQRSLSDSYVVTAPKRSLAGLAPEEKAFRSGVRFCGFLALFLGLYIIFNTMSMSLVERVRSIGLLRALGLTRGWLGAVFLTEGLALASLGAGLALLLAQGIVAVLVDMEITTLGHGKPIVISEWPIQPVVQVVVAGVVFCLAGVLYPFLRASRLSVIDALRRGVIELSRDPFTGVRRTVLVGMLAVVPVAWLVGAPSDEFVPAPLYEAVLLAFGLVGSVFALLLLVPGLLHWFGLVVMSPFRGPAATLTRSTLGAARHRVFGTVSGLMLVFTAVFLIVSVLESLKAETRDFGQRALAGRLFIKTTPEGGARIAALRSEAPEFETLLSLNAEVTSSFLIRGIHPRMLEVGLLARSREDREDFIRRRTIILSTRCADDLDKRAGDTVRLATAATGLEDFRVLAVTDEYGFAPDDRVFGVVSSDNMLNYWCIDSAGLGDYFVAWSPGLKQGRFDQLRLLAEKALGADNVLEFRRGEQITAGYVDDLDLNFAMFYAILVLTILLAAVGILNAMVIAVMERRREIGLLRAVGLTGGQLAAMLLMESGVLGVLGGVFGLILGIPLAVVTANALTSVSHLELAFAVTPRAMGAVLGGAILISLGAVLLPALRANRLKLSEVMRYE